MKYVLEIGRNHIRAYTNDEVQAMLKQLEQLHLDPETVAMFDKVTFEQVDKILNGPVN